MGELEPGTRRVSKKEIGGWFVATGAGAVGFVLGSIAACKGYNTENFEPAVVVTFGSAAVAGLSALRGCHLIDEYRDQNPRMVEQESLAEQLPLD